MRNKPYAFLGRYLVGNGAISEDQLDEAVRLQRENNSLIGTIALTRGFLDNTQLNRLIKRQTTVDERLGQLAIREGYMTEDDLAAVLAIQGRNHIYLGESLVRLGTMNSQTLQEALVDFESQIVAQERSVREEINDFAMAKELLVTLDVTLRFFYRLGYAVRIVGFSDGPPDGFEHLYCSEQIFRKTGIGYMGVGMAGMLAESITHGPRIRERTDLHIKDAMEAMSQLIFNLNYQACKRMKQHGVRVRHGDAFVDAPERAGMNGVHLELETVTSPMVLAYGDRPARGRAPAAQRGLVRMAL